jgi:enterochelin esterase family protein
MYAICGSAQQLPPTMKERDLIQLYQGQPKSDAAAAAIRVSFPEKALTGGTAVATHRGVFLFAFDSAAEPRLFIDGRPSPEPMRKSKSGNLWVATATLEEGTSHSFHYEVAGQRAGGRTDVPAFLADSYERSGVQPGLLTPAKQHLSRVYDGMAAEYRVYVPFRYKPSEPAGVMVWQDGHSHVGREGNSRTLTVIDNLTADGRIPPLVHVFVSPGKVGEKSLRSVQYDTVSETYALYLRDEILAEVERDFPLRKDAYSRAIAGQSSGGICAFNAAWQHPELFSRVLSMIGSYTSIQWKPGIGGGHDYPFKVRKEPKRNIRVWLQDGMQDLENDHGSWPLQNVQMANSLKMKGYDFHFSWSEGTHNMAHSQAEMPRALAWLWRGYDPAKPEEQFEQEPAEKDQPLFRVRVVNR